MSDQAAPDTSLTTKMMRLAANLRDREASNYIDKPFATAGRTLDRVIRKVLGDVPVRVPMRVTQAVSTSPVGGRCRADLTNRAVKTLRS